MAIVFEGPQELAEAAVATWEGGDGLPSKEQISAVISELYKLSLSVDEGRYPQLLFAFTSNEQPSRTVIRLGTTLVHLAEIVALAPAIAPPPFAIVLDGLVPTCKSILNLKGSSAIPGAYFGVRGPGELEVTTCQGERPPCSWTLVRGQCKRARDISNSSTFDTLCQRAALDTNVHADEAAELLRRVVSSVLGLAHGGTLLFYDGKPESATRPLVDFNAEPYPLLPHRATREPVLHASADNPDTVDAAARLTQIDGAVLLDSRFNIRGGGVFLDQQHTTVQLIDESNTATEARMSDLGLGSRHRSAAWFCRENIEAKAIVLSRDRGIRVFRHLPDKQVAMEGPYWESMVPF